MIRKLAGGLILLLISMALVGCSQDRAKMGDKVKVHYTLYLADGTEKESTVGKKPYQVTLGRGGSIIGFDNGIVGLAVGETKTVIVPPEDAYGRIRPDLVQVSHRDEFPPGGTLEVGAGLSGRLADGSMVQFRIVAIEGDSVTVDGNHPMAGQTLTFELELVEIVE